MKHTDSTGSDSEDEVKLEDVPVAVIEGSRAKDPRSKAKYNLFSRLLLWYVRDSVLIEYYIPCIHTFSLPPAGWILCSGWAVVVTLSRQTSTLTPVRPPLRNCSRPSTGTVYLVLEFGELGPPLFLHL